MSVLGSVILMVPLSLFVSPHGLLSRCKADITTLKGRSKTNKAKLWAAAETVNDRGSPADPLRHPQ